MELAVKPKHRSPIEIGNWFSKYQDGSSAWYSPCPGNLDVGIKVYKNNDWENAEHEYLVTKYLEGSGVTTKAHALIEVRIHHPRLSRKVVRPAIIMEHIQGETLECIFDGFHIDDIDDMNEDDENKPLFKQIRTKVRNTIHRLESNYKVLFDDHIDNMNNFILDVNDNIRVIDFSLGTRDYYGIDVNEEQLMFLKAAEKVTLSKEEIFDLLGL